MRKSKTILVALLLGSALSLGGCPRTLFGAAVLTAAIVGTAAVLAYHDAHYHDAYCGHHRRWHNGHWVYYYGGHWEYHHGGRWYYYQ